MTWSIDIPFRDRDDPVSEIGFAARDLPDEDDRKTVRQLALDAILAGTQTCGELLDELQELSEPARRQRLDDARRAVGLDSATELDQRREQRRINSRFAAEDIPGPPSWSEWQGCPAQGCNARPTDPAGALRPVTVNRWWCPSHQHLAAPGDLEEYEPPYIGFTHTGAPVPSEREKARIAEEIRKRDEPREREREQREAVLAAEAEALEAVRERFDREETISVAGVKVSPASVRVN